MIRYLFFLLLLLSCQDKQIVVSNPTIIPKPVKMILNEGFYNWSSNAQIISDSLFVSEKKYFQSDNRPRNILKATTQQIHFKATSANK